MWPLVFIPIWLVGWFAGEVAVGAALVAGPLGVSLTKGGPPEMGVLMFMAFWLAFWTFGGIVAALSWLWMLAGVQTVEIDSGTLTIRSEMLGWRRTRSYLVETVRGIRVDRIRERKRVSPIFNLAFDYGGKTIRFARRQNATELGEIAKAIAERRPSVED